MEVLYFFKERTRFIRHLYETAAQPFQETIQAIEDEAPPFDNPPYSEDPEPAFLEEWMQATEELEVLGRACLSMLSPSLHLYFKTWEGQLGVSWKEGERQKVFKKGFLAGYKICFGEVLDLSWDQCPADLALIEQIALARNRDQHPENITSMRVDHARQDLVKYPRPFFAREVERRSVEESGFEGGFFFSPSVHVSRKALFAAIDEVEKLAEWLEDKMMDRRYG